MNKLFAISAGHEATLSVAREILLQGGNAFDAAIAAYVTMFVAEPCMASAGAGGLAMCYAHGERPVMLDFFTQTPGSKQLEQDPEYIPVEVDFGNTTETFYHGMGSIAIPGAMAGIGVLHERYGTIPLNELFKPAREMARIGVAVNEFQSIDIGLLQSIIKCSPELKAAFFEGDQVVQKGDLLKLPMMDDFLDHMGREGIDAFYRGEIGRRVADDSREHGGFIRRSDMEAYEATWVDPVEIEAYGQRIFLPNGPSVGGAVMALLILELQNNGNRWIDAITKIRKSCSTPQEIIQTVKRVLPHLPFDFRSSIGTFMGTSHFNIVDRDGNAIALSTTIGEGSGYSIPGTQMHMNNMLGEPYLLPQGPHSWTPNVRLNSMMTPLMVFENKDFRYAGGSGGAGRIPYMIAQVIDYLFNADLELRDATNSGRMHIHNGELHLEYDLKRTLSAHSIPEKHWDYRSLFFGGVHSIHVNDTIGLTEAAGDPRRSGVSYVEGEG